LFRLLFVFCLKNCLYGHKSDEFSFLLLFFFNVARCFTQRTKQSLGKTVFRLYRMYFTGIYDDDWIIVGVQNRVLCAAGSV
jgi:hypothetical protein